MSSSGSARDAEAGREVGPELLAGSLEVGALVGNGRVPWGKTDLISVPDGKIGKPRHVLVTT
jgi:hypothetical protein